ncbi:hypothetical protein BWZ22_00555 [Seonamhaeicola sp. S2-3]|uniref:hypothetical protein n=1 Tax=Seonamhaeicola sp. S2-3 TaxID=1936081 RepID=UPI0009727650|nr:hypothetical protein [Seonamhaeicola sp. S2-3]APY09826.1 hypothetical protein BWZ22_00555 [Seonamhaeicola sp. S2-3]
MENLDSIQYQFLMTGIISGIVHVIIFIASIILIYKKRTIATAILLTGSVLSLISYFGSFALNIWAARISSKLMIKTQITMSFFQGFSFLIFGVGLLLLAINNFKKQ